MCFVCGRGTEEKEEWVRAHASSNHPNNEFPKTANPAGTLEASIECASRRSRNGCRGDMCDSFFVAAGILDIERLSHSDLDIFGSTSGTDCCVCELESRS